MPELGYESVGVNDPGEALSAFEEDPEAWDVVVTDEVMPAIRGSDLVCRLKAIRPEIRTILCTGYSEGLDDGASRATDAYLRKPVDALEIARQIRLLLDSPETAQDG